MERKHSISPARKSEEKSIPVVEDQPTNNHVILDEDGDERKMSSFRAYVRLWSYSSPLDIFLRVVAGVAALSAGSAYPLMTIVFGNLINNFNDAAMGSLSPAKFRASVNDNTIWFLYLFIGKFALLYIANFLFCFTATRIARRIRLKYLSKVLHQPISHFDRHTPGSIAASLSADTNMIEVGLADKVASLGQGIGMVITAFGIGFAKSWKMTLVIGTTIPWVLLVTGSLGSLQSKLENKKRDLFSQASSIAEEAISSIANITALGALEKIVEKFAKPVGTASRCTIRIGPATATIYGNMFFTMQCGYSLALFYGVKLVSNHEIKNGGTLITVLFCMLMSTSAMGIIAPSIPTFIKAAAAAQEVLRVVEQKIPEDEVRNMGENPLPESVEGNLQLQHITFAYPQRPDIKVLDKLNLDIMPGKTTAVVGQSGSGKSTIIGLLERWYDPDEGTVRFDGEDIRELDRNWLRNQLSLVQQEPILFNTTILQNVLNGLRGVDIQNLGSPEKRDLVMNACIMANAHDFIQNLPDGYDTNVGERAHLLSGGQKQRIAIARSLISNPKILLLDEPTSALDSESENAVQIALEKASKGRTTLMISHKLATVRTAYRILVMDNGAIVEEGTHSSLLEKDGLYCRLFHAQTTESRIETGEKVTGIEGVHTPTSEKHLLHTEASNIEKPSDSILILDSVEIARKHSLISGITWIVLGARSTWLSFFGGTVGSIIAGACIPMQSYLFSKLVTVFQLHGAKLVDRGTFWALMFFILAITNLASYAILWFLFSITASIVTRKHRSGYLRDVLNQDIHFFELPGHSSGALSALMGADGDDIESTFTMNIGLLMVFFVDIVSCCILAISVGWKLGLVGVFGCYPIMFFAGYVRMRMETTAQDRCASSFLESSRYSSEAVEEIRTVSAFTMEEKVLEGYSRRLRSAVVTSLKRNLGLMALFGLSDSIDLLAIALVFWYGGKLVSTSFMSVQSYFIVYMCIIFGGQGAGFIFGFSSSITKAQGAANRIHHMSSLKPKINSTTGLHPSETPIMDNEVIKLNDVHFTYPSRPDVEVLQGLSFKIHPGETVCFVGPSGCGKSTIISLLERFYDITSGSLKINNTPIQKYDIKSLRQTLSLVSQETNLFQGTIRENICLGIPSSSSIPEERIIEVSKQANIHDFIVSLPEGYSTPCGPRGRLLSGGQRQRIAIARALLRDPKVLLLDEATSALDNESQGLIVDALGKVGEGRTVVCVSHQEEIMRLANRIFVVEHGGVVEEGGYEELMSRRGRFWEMRDALIGEG